MSLVTRCPACTTTFKVVLDQLRISDGWVRCGRCSHVFDASLDLRELADAQAGTVATPPAEAEPEPPAPVPEPESPEPEPEPEPEPPSATSVASSDDADFFDEVLLPEQPAAASPKLPQMPNLSLGAVPPVGLIADEPWPDPPLHSGFDELDSEPAALTSQLTPQRSVADMAPSLDLDPVGQLQLQKDLRRARMTSLKLARARKREADADAEAAALPVVAEVPVKPQNIAPVVQTASEPEQPPVAPPAVPSFLRAASSSAFWRGGKGKAILWTGIAVAAVLLAVQVLHRDRDAIAASQPALRPLLESVCAVTGCKLSALRRISDITIDGAAFAREKTGDGYRLSFTLRSAATVPLAMPAIELTLLDTQEQAVVRRVLLPAEFGAPAVLPARADRAASLPLALGSAEAAALPPIAGYRVVAFYP
ncbi:MAG: DUF3426 domain-containing protein [Variovorax sp.]|nr:MAG: DUF3426 domain-containing protein [Variovorax sp.]